MMGHLGPRVSALLDGQLSPEEAERAWAHVHTCHQCRDQVEREGWVKTRLAGLSPALGAAPAHLKGSLLDGQAGSRARPAPAPSSDLRHRVSPGVVLVGGGAVGAAVMGVLALGLVAGEAPPGERRPPVTQLVRPSPSFTPVVSPERPGITP